MMLKTYRGPLPIHSRWYELWLGTFRSSDLSVAPNRGEEHNTRDMIRTYNDTMREGCDGVWRSLCSCTKATGVEDC